MLGEVAVRREYRLYEDVPAIACDMYLRGTLNGSLATGSENIAAHKNIESVQDMASRATAEIILDQLFLPGRHWHCKAVSFKDITDWGNYYPYRTLRNRCLSYDSPSSDRIRSAFA